MAYTYSILVGGKTTDGAIRNWANRNDVPANFILLEAEAWIYQRLRVREMRTREAISAASGETGVALPDGFLDPVKFMLRGHGRELPFVHESALKRVEDDDGNVLEASVPTRWAIDGTRMEFDVKLDTALNGVLQFYKQPDALSGSNETNFLTTRYPTLLRRACMGYAYEHMKQWMQMKVELDLATLAMEETKVTDDLSRRSQIYEGAHYG